MSTTVHTAHGEGRIVESETVRGVTRHRVASLAPGAFDMWLPETQVHTASAEDGWEPIPDQESANIFSDPGFPEAEVDTHSDPDHGREDMMAEQGGGDGDFTDALDGLSEFAATGEVGPEAQAEFSGSPDMNSLLGHRMAGYDENNECSECGAHFADPHHPSCSHADKHAALRQGGPGDHVDDSNSVHLPYNPDPQHDAVTTTPDASWGPGDMTIDADERLHPADSLTLNDVGEDEGGPYPGPAPHLFAGALDVRDADEWASDYDDRNERLVDEDEARGLEREHRFHQHDVDGLDRAASLGDKYVDVGYGLHIADHFHDPVQMFRDDSHGFIERRGSIVHDTDLDRYAYLLDAEAERAGGWDKTAAWRDVHAKAKRLRDSGKVTVKDISPDRIYATVVGDNGTYETLITKGSSLGGYDAYGARGDQHVGNWHCSCKWGDWAFKRRFTFIGRLCSHGLASYWEMQAAHQAQASGSDDPRRSRVKTKRKAEYDSSPRMRDDRGLGQIIDHYGPHDKVDREQEFGRRTDAAEDYAHRTDLPGDDDDVPLGLYAQRHADLLRTTPRSMTPDLNFIDRPDYDTETVDVTGLKDVDMPGAETTFDTERESSDEIEAARRLGRRVVAWIVDEILPDFEEWYATNHGRQLDQARPTEAAADYAQERGLDQSTSEMLQEWINKNFTAEDAHDPEGEPEIKHFEMAAGRYLMASMRQAGPLDEPTGPRRPGQGPTGLPWVTPNGGIGLNPTPQLNPDMPDQQGPTGLPWVLPNGGIGLNPAPGSNPQIGTPPTTPDQMINPSASPNGTPGTPHGGTGAPPGPGAPPGSPASGEGLGPRPGPAPGEDVSLAGASEAAPYTVQKGDTLSDIAEKNGLGSDWKSLYDTNKGVVGDNPDLILPGQQLNLPGAEHSGTGATPGPAASSDESPSASTPPASSSSGSAPAVPAPPSSDGGLFGPAGAGSTPPATPAAGSSTPGETTGPGGAPNNPLDHMLGGRVRHANYVLASDDSLLNHLRELSTTSAAEDLGHMDARNDDVRDTVDELRERGYDASQLVAMVRQADDETDADPFHRKNPDPDHLVPTPGSPGSWQPKPSGSAGTSTPQQTQVPALGTTPATFPTPSGGPSAPSAPSAAAPTSPSTGGGAGGGNVPPRPQGGSTESAIGGTGESLPGGSSGASKPTKPGEEEGGDGGGGGFGGDFMSALPELGGIIGPIADGIGSAMGPITEGLSGLLGGGGLGDLGGLASGLSGILGAAMPHNDTDDRPLLGEQAISVGDVPTGFAGSGPDHQHWTSSSEDYVDAHERDRHEDIDDFDGDILKYSGTADGTDSPFYSAWKQANAFDNYADWGYAETGSADPDDWGSVESFLDDAEERQGYLGDTGPAKATIKDHLQYSSALSPEFMAHLAAAGGNAGYFGVGATPQLPTADGLSHTNGAANLRAVSKPKKVKGPKAPRLPMFAPGQGAAPQQRAIQPQQQQMGQQPQLFSAPPPVTEGMGAPQLAQPRTSRLAAPGQIAPQVTSERVGGIQRQAAQVGSGSLAPVFAEMGFSAPPSPQYGAYEAISPAQVVDYNPYRTAAPGPIHTSPWDDDPLPGQHMAALDPQPMPGQRMGGIRAAAMRDDYQPAPTDYTRTNDQSDVVRRFQAQMGGADWATGYTPTGPGDYDVSAGAHQFLGRTAGRIYSQDEQMRLEQESHPQGARNLDELDLTNTHYLG